APSLKHGRLSIVVRAPLDNVSMGGSSSIISGINERHLLGVNSR
ncbi:unnamed protein product, partial [Adineta steineri]